MNKQVKATAVPSRTLRADFTVYTLRAALTAKQRASQKQKLRRLVQEAFTMKKFRLVRTVPGAALATAVIAVGSVGAYALANNWFGTSVHTATMGNSVTVTANGCPASLLQAYQDHNAKGAYDIATTYIITKPDIITPADIQANQLVTCEERAVDDVAMQAFPAEYDGNNYQTTGQYNAMYMPNGTYGRVQSVRGNVVTLQDVPADTPYAKQQRVAVTFTVPVEAKILIDGKADSLTNFKPGDQVYVSFQDPNSDKSAYKDSNLTATSVVRAIAKTEYDYSAKDKMFMAAGKGAFRIEKTSDAVSG